MHFDVRDLLILSTIPGIGPARLRSLVTHFKDPAVVARATPQQLVSVEGIEKKTALAIANFYRDSGPSLAKRFVDEQLSRLNKVEGRIVTIWDKEYPSLLKRIYDPPPFLFVRGTLERCDECSVAVVGTRSPTHYGTGMAERFSTGLAKLGITIVSGLARGIDTCAHNATLKSKGRTVAVIGSGVDVIYPPENRSLVEKIIDSGAVISEYVMGTKPDAGNFPRRNRIISGMSLATIIVETAADGGAMITARTALDQNREVFAIPAEVNERRRSGTNLLIKQGSAMLVESVDDILEELGPALKRAITLPAHIKEEPEPDLNMFERKLIEALGNEQVHIDKLAERAGFTTSDTLVHLLGLEFKGVVKQMPGKMFART